MSGACLGAPCCGRGARKACQRATCLGASLRRGARLRRCAPLTTPSPPSRSRWGPPARARVRPRAGRLTQLGPGFGCPARGAAARRAPALPQPGRPAALRPRQATRLAPHRQQAVALLLRHRAAILGAQPRLLLLLRRQLLRARAARARQRRLRHQARGDTAAGTAGRSARACCGASCAGCCCAAASAGSMLPYAPPWLRWRVRSALGCGSGRSFQFFCAAEAALRPRACIARIAHASKRRATSGAGAQCTNRLHERARAQGLGRYRWQGHNAELVGLLCSMSDDGGGGRREARGGEGTKTPPAPVPGA